MAKFDGSLLVVGVRPMRRPARLGGWLAIAGGLALALLIGAGLRG